MITLHSHFVRALLRRHEALGIDKQRLLSEARIPAEVVDDENSTLRVSGEQYAVLVRRVWEVAGDENFGLTRTPCKAGHFHLMIHYVQQFDTLEAVIRELCHFYRTVRDDIRFELLKEDDQAGFLIELDAPELDVDHFLVEFLLCNMHRFLCWLTDTRLSLAETRFTIDEPNYSAEYGDIFPGPLRFGQKCDGIFFDAGYLSKKVTRSWRECQAMLADSPFSFIIIPGSDNSITATVKGILIAEHRIGNGFPELNRIADMLNITEQTARRRLLKEGQTYQKIKSEIRRDIAIDRLVHSELPVADIGYQLGFVEPASFTRAFQRWTGLSPSEYRTKARS